MRPSKRRGAQRARRKNEKRRLRVQALEQRQMLAGDMMHNVDMPEDVNADGNVSSLDALVVINDLSRRARNRDAVAEDPNERMFRDVNNDGQVTPLDALQIMNRMASEERERRGGGRGGNGQNGDGQNDGNGNNDDNNQTPTPADPVAEVRSIDGTGNNLENPELGAAGIELTRWVDADYEDGISSPAGEDRASAREISNIIFDQEGSVLNNRGLSDILWQWGQFIDHDITLTGEAAEDGHESYNIPVPQGDPEFDPQGTGTQEIELTRSGVAEGTGIDSERQQTNDITAFLDGSMVYGSDEDTAASLREFEGGRLLTSEGDLLPINQFSGFFEAGDVRANEQHGLIAMHTLFVREHNRIADELAAADPSLTDEEIYQEARAIVGAEIQAITFNEFLPALLGRNAISDYEGYDPSIDPSISNVFATGAFRFGHSALSSELQRLNDDGTVIDEGNILLRDAFFNPTDVLELGIDPILKGLTSNISQEIDTQVIDDVRNFLFGPPGSGGFDLVALNIQRGRDHGLPSYNAAREQLGLTPVQSFADITSDEDLQARLAEAYENVDDIDLWVGALAEDHYRGGSLGELATHVLVEQFTALRDGDRFWYENVFEGRQLREINNTSLSDIIERNTDLTTIQNNAFVVPRDVAIAQIADELDDSDAEIVDEPPVDGGQDNGDRGGGRGRR